MNSFVTGAFLPAKLFAAVTDLRVRAPRLVRELAAARRRRATLAPDGKLVIVAADHPARRVLQAGADPWAMADRAGYLERIVRVLLSPEIDGVMATADVLDELFLLNHLVTEVGGPDFLSEKVLIGCLNRGGLAGAAWELDDFVTGHTAEAAVAQGLDGVKMLLRLNLQERASARTLGYCAQAIASLAAVGLPAFVEPLPVVRGENGGWTVEKSADGLVPVVGIAAGLGPSSMGIWLKLPMLHDFQRVAAATTCPILLLGGESVENPTVVLREVEQTVAAGHNVRGLMIGRNVLYPGPGEDPQAVAIALSRIVRGMWTAKEAATRLPELRGRDLDTISARAVRS